MGAASWGAPEETSHDWAFAAMTNAEGCSDTDSATSSDDEHLRRRTSTCSGSTRKPRNVGGVFLASQSVHSGVLCAGKARARVRERASVSLTLITFCKAVLTLRVRVRVTGPREKGLADGRTPRAGMANPSSAAFVGHPFILGLGALVGIVLPQHPRHHPSLRPHSPILCSASGAVRLTLCHFLSLHQGPSLLPGASKVQSQRQPLKLRRLLSSLPLILNLNPCNPCNLLHRLRLRLQVQVPSPAFGPRSTAIASAYACIFIRCCLGLVHLNPCPNPSQWSADLRRPGTGSFAGALGPGTGSFAGALGPRYKSVHRCTRPRYRFVRRYIRPRYSHKYR